MMAQLPETMLEAQVQNDTSVTFHTVPVPPITHPSQILIKVIVSGCNPKDWKMPAGILKTIGQENRNSGDDIAGIVAAVGKDVHDIKPGDRVAALHQLGAPYGSYAEYAIAWDFTTFHLGPDVSFEDAAVFPMAIMMASLGLFAMLQVNHGPWTAGEGTNTPLVIYGAASSVGSMAVKLATLSGIHPLICVCGNGISTVEKLIDKSKGDTIVDYRKGDDAVVQGIKDALNGRKLEYAFDAVSEKGSYINLGKIVDTQTGKMTFVLGVDHSVIPKGIEQTTTMAGNLWPNFHVREDVATAASDVGNLGIGRAGPEFGLVYSRVLGKWIREGKLRPPTYEVAPGGLRGIETALKNLRAGQTGKKYVFRIRETPELADKS